MAAPDTPPSPGVALQTALRALCANPNGVFSTLIARHGLCDWNQDQDETPLKTDENHGHKVGALFKEVEAIREYASHLLSLLQQVEQDRFYVLMAAVEKDKPRIDAEIKRLAASAEQRATPGSKVVWINYASEELRYQEPTADDACNWLGVDVRYP